MIWELIKKEFKEHYLTDLIFCGVLFVITLYSIFRGANLSEFTYEGKVWGSINYRVAASQLIISVLISMISISFMSILGFVRGTSSLKKERDRGTLEFLMSLPIDGKEIIVSKFLAYFIELIIVAVITLFLSFLPMLRLIIQGFNAYQDIWSVFRLNLINLSLAVFFSLFVFVSVQSFDVVIMPLRIRGFLKFLAFLFYWYVLIRLLTWGYNLFSFLPKNYIRFELMSGEFAFNYGSQWPFVATTALLMGLLLGGSIVWFNNKGEV